MSQELIYTSAPKGLKLGSRGFCTVASTTGMAKNLADRLEALSGYRHVFAPGSPQAALNPVDVSYLRFRLGGRTYHVLSRIADAGLDYTQRTNKLAHHVVLDHSELVSGGPAWLASQPGFLETRWEEEPRILPTGRSAPSGDLNAGVCQSWKAIAGDAGWAGVLAQTIADVSSETYVIFRPGTDVLKLLVEAQAILPPQARWLATFSTYFTKVPPGVECRWRCVADGTPEALLARRSPGNVVIDLAKDLGPAPDGELVVAARSGRVSPSRRATVAAPIAQAASPAIDLARDSVEPAKQDQLRFAATATGAAPPLLPGQSASRWAAGSTGQLQGAPRHSVWHAASLLIAVVTGAAICALVFFVLAPRYRGVESTAIPTAETRVASEVKEDQDTHSGEVKPTPNVDSDRGTPQIPAAVAAPAVASPAETAGPSDKPQQPPPEATAEPTHQLPSELVPSASADSSPAVPTATADSPPQADGGDAEHKLPQDLFGSIVPAVKLPTISRSSFGNSPILLGTFPIADPPITLALLGLAPNATVTLEPTDSAPPKQWVIRDGSRDVARFEIIVSGSDGTSRLEFSWTDKAQYAQSRVEEEIRSSVLSLRVNDGSADVKPVYIALSPAVIREPRHFSRKLAKDGEDTIPMEVPILNAEMAKVYLRLEGLPEPNDSANGCAELAEGQKYSVLLGPEESVVLEIKFSIDPDGDAYIAAQLLSSETQEVLPRVVRAQASKRKRLLREAITSYVYSDYGRSLWTTWAKTTGFPVRQWRPTDSVGAPIGPVQYDLPPAELKSFLNSRQVNLIALEEEFRPGKNDKHPDGEMNKDLKRHQEAYPYLQQWAEIAGGLPDSLGVHIRVARQLTDNVAGVPVEIDVFTAGDPKGS